MANIKLDFSKMRHIRSDDKSTTLRHPDGHEITLAHKALAPDNQKALSALAGIAKDASQSVDQKMADGGQAKQVSDTDYQNMINNRINSADVRPQPTPSPTPSAWQTFEQGANQLGADIKQAVGAKAEGGEINNSDFTQKPKDDKKQQVKENTIDYSKFKKQKPSGGTLDYSKFPDEMKKRNRLAQGGAPLDEATVIKPDKGFGKIIMTGQAEGGEVDVSEPRAPDHDFDTELAAPEDVKPAASEPEDSPLRMKTAMANGGTCMHCGGQMGRKMYANPQDTVSPQDAAPVQQPSDDLPTQAGQFLGTHLINPLVAFGKGTVDEMKQLGQIGGRFTQGVEHSTGVNLNSDEDINAPASTPTDEVMQMNPLPAEANLAQTGAQQQTAATNAQNNAVVAGARAAGAQEKDKILPQLVTSDVSDPVSNVKAGMENYIKGTELKAQALGTQGFNQSVASQNAANQLKDVQTAFDSHVQKIEQERQGHIQDIQNGYIDPNKYWTGDENGDGGHSKIAAGIGMILAGFNPTARPNAAMEFLQHQMDNNLKAQAGNLTAKQNLLTANLQQFHNLKDAADMTRVMQNDVAVHQINAAAQKAMSPMAKAEAMQTIGQFQNNSAMIVPKIAASQAMMSLANGKTTASGSIGHALNQLDVVDPERSKIYRPRYYPPFDQPGGKAVADNDIPAATRSELDDHSKFDQAATDMRDIVQQYRGVNFERLSPSLQAKVKADSVILQSLFRGSTLKTVYKAGEQPVLDKAVDGNPLDLYHYFTAVPKLNALIDSNIQQRNKTAAGVGLYPPGATNKQPSAPQQQSPQVAMAWAKDPRNANDPRAKSILQQSGK